MLKKNKFISCLLISTVLHVTILCVVFNTYKRNVFLSVPIEVVFYSNSEQLLDQSPRMFFKNSEPSEQVEEEIRDDNSNESSTTPQEAEKTSQEDVVILNKKEKLKKIITKKNIKKEKKSLEKQNNKVSTKDENKKALDVVNSISGVTGNNSNVQTHNIQDTNNFAMFGSQYEGLSFEDKNFKFAYYANQIVSKIKRHWNWSLSYKDLRTVVYFKIHRDGTVSDVLVKKSSKKDEYDKFAVDTIVRASPFPQLPEGYTEDFLGVYFEFLAS
jgi:TonB family protein